MRSVGRAIGTWLLVMGTAVVALQALDRVPTLAVRAPRGVQIYRSVDDAERAVGARVWMPGYYPDELRWPPARVEVAWGRPPAVAIRVHGTDGTANRLTIVQTLGTGVPPPNVLPRGEPMGRSEVTVGGHAGVLSRVLIGSRELHDLSWSQGGRGITLRYAGPVERLMLIGASLARRVDERGAR